MTSDLDLASGWGLGAWSLPNASCSLPTRSGANTARRLFSRNIFRAGLSRFNSRSLDRQIIQQQSTDTRLQFIKLRNRIENVLSRNYIFLRWIPDQECSAKQQKIEALPCSSSMCWYSILMGSTVNNRTRGEEQGVPNIVQCGGSEVNTVVDTAEQILCMAEIVNLHY